MATHIAAGSGHDVSDYAAAIDRLADLDVLPREFARGFRGVAGFRNVLVHGYLELAARGDSRASHRDCRGVPRARRDDREYREYSRKEQRSPRECIGGRMQPDFHHGLLDLAIVHRLLETGLDDFAVFARHVNHYLESLAKR